MRARKSWNEHNPDSWKCAVWPVQGGDPPLQTFVATRSLDKPPPGEALAVVPPPPSED